MYVHSEFSDKYFYRRLDVTCIYLSEMPTRNTLVVKKSWPRSEKRLWWNQKRVSKACAGMLLIILLMMTQATKHWGKKHVLHPASSLSKIFVIYSIPAQALATPFWFHIFSSQHFSGLGSIITLQQSWLNTCLLL